MDNLWHIIKRDNGTTTYFKFTKEVNNFQVEMVFIEDNRYSTINVPIHFIDKYRGYPITTDINDETVKILYGK